jgi:hypothetical protein
MNLHEVMEEGRRADERRLEEIRKRGRAIEARYLVEGVMLFAVFEFLFGGLSAGRLLLLAVPGLALGWICHRFRAGTAFYTVAGAVAYAAVYGPFGLIAFWHFLLFIVGAAALGATHEMQRADGSE